MQLFCCEFADAVGADVLALEGAYTLGVSAEDAGRLILFEDDRVGIRIDFQSILFANLQSSPQFDRKNDASQLIDFANDTGRFQVAVPPDQYNCCRNNAFLGKL